MSLLRNQTLRAKTKSLADVRSVDHLNEASSFANLFRLSIQSNIGVSCETGKQNSGRGCNCALGQMNHFKKALCQLLLSRLKIESDRKLIFAYSLKSDNTICGYSLCYVIFAGLLERSSAQEEKPTSAMASGKQIFGPKWRRCHPGGGRQGGGISEVRRGREREVEGRQIQIRYVISYRQTR